jgi:hypothetical protein
LELVEKTVALVAFLAEFLPAMDLPPDFNSLGISYFAVDFDAIVKEALERLGEGIDGGCVKVVDTTSRFDVDEELLLQMR